MPRHSKNAKLKSQHGTHAPIIRPSPPKTATTSSTNPLSLPPPPLQIQSRMRGFLTRKSMGDERRAQNRRTAQQLLDRREEGRKAAVGATGTQFQGQRLRCALHRAPCDPSVVDTAVGDIDSGASTVAAFPAAIASSIALTLTTTLLTLPSPPHLTHQALPSQASESATTACTHSKSKSLAPTVERRAAGPQECAHAQPCPRRCARAPRPR